MKIIDILNEARVDPDYEFIERLKPNVEAALQNYNDFLQENNDVDDIEELVDLLNFECEDDVPEVLFVASG